MELRAIAPGEKDGVLDLLAEWYDDRAFFARYLENDPTFREDLCFVAVDEQRIVSTLQVFRKQVRARQAILEVGAVGNVFTSEAYRGRGLATRLLSMAVAGMQSHGFDVSLLFATRLAFYGAHGWRSLLRYFDFVAAGTCGPLQEVPDLSIAGFAADDLPAIMSIYDSYNRTLRASTVRDVNYWKGQLRYAGNPDEDFLVARRNGEIVAYVRGTSLYEVYVLLEHGCTAGHEPSLAALMVRLLTQEAAEAPGMLTHLASFPVLRELLSSLGASISRIEDYFWMWRVIAPQQLAAKLDLGEEEVATDDLFLEIFPPEQSVYWTSDRF